MKKILLTLITTIAISAHASWVYNSEIDKMTGNKSFEVTAKSDNELYFGFPYKGSNHGYLVVRKHPKHGTNVIFAIDKGQMLCRSNDCSVSVKFDEAKPVTFSGTGPADHSSTVIFIDNAKRFINNAKKAKKILVQFNAYQNGSPILEFSTGAPLEWPPKE